MRYVFGIDEYLPLLRDYAGGIKNEIEDEIAGWLMDEGLIYSPPSRVGVLEQLLMGNLVTALLVMMVYDRYVPTGDHLQAAYEAVYHRIYTQIEEHTEADVSGNVYQVDDVVGMNVAHLDDIGDIAGFISNEIINKINELDIQSMELYLEATQSLQRNLYRTIGRDFRMEDNLEFKLDSCVFMIEVTHPRGPTVDISRYTSKTEYVSGQSRRVSSLSAQIIADVAANAKLAWLDCMR